MECSPTVRANQVLRTAHNFRCCNPAPDMVLNCPNSARHPMNARLLSALVLFAAATLHAPAQGNFFQRGPTPAANEAPPPMRMLPADWSAKLKWRTIKKRLRVKVRAMRDWIRTHLGMPLASLWKAVNRRLAGHYAYYHVSDNWAGVMEYRRQTMKALWWGLNRRSQRRSMGWRAFVGYVGRHSLVVPGRVVSLNPTPTV